MDRVDTAALLLLGSSQITWEQITPPATQGKVPVMALLTSSPERSVPVKTLEEDFGLAWAQEECWDTSSEVRGVSQPWVNLGEQTPPLPGPPHQQAQEHVLPQDLVVPKEDEMLKTKNLVMTVWGLSLPVHLECKSLSGNKLYGTHYYYLWQAPEFKWERWDSRDF